MIDLEERHRIIVDAVFSAHFRHCRVYVFGSRAHVGRAQKYSDLDLALWAPKPLPGAGIDAAREAFSASDLPFTVDLVDLATTDAAFRERVISEGVEIACPMAKS